MADHEDYKVIADLTDHIADPSAHHARYTDAEARAAINDIFGSDGKADVDIDLDTHKLINVVDPTNNQDVVTLAYFLAAGAAHVADASAHHVKYTDAEARAAISPLSIPASAFAPRHDTSNWQLSEYFLQVRSVLAIQYFYAPVFLPNGCTVTKFTLYGYRDDALALLRVNLFRTDREEVRVIMAMCNAVWTDGYNSVYDDSITSPVIDNNNYQYVLRLELDPNDAVGDVKLSGVKIDFTG